MYYTLEERLRCPGIIAIDIDGTTIHSGQWPDPLTLKPDAKKYINKLHKEGFFLIFWTCRSKVALQKAADFFKIHGINYHLMNKQHPYLIEKYGDDTRKLAFDVVVEDLCIYELPGWKTIYKRIHKKLDNKQSILHI